MAPASYGPGPTYGHAGPAFGTGGPAFHQPPSVMSQLDTLRHRQNGHGHLLEDVQRTGHGTQQAVESLRNGLQNMHSLLVNTNTDVANLRNSQAPLNAAVHEIQLVSPGSAPSTAVPYARHLPRPSKLAGDPDLDKSIGDREVWFASVTSYMGRTGMNLLNDFEFFLEGPAATWFKNLRAYYRSTGKALNATALQAEFKRAYGDLENQSEPQRVRERISAGEARQTPGMPVSQYVQKFTTLLLEAPDMAEADRIQYFFDNMLPSLARDAIVDGDNKRHKTLASAIDAAYAAELGYRMRKRASASAAVASIPKGTDSDDCNNASSSDDEGSDGDGDATVAYVKRLPHRGKPHTHSKHAPRTHAFKHTKRPDRYVPLRNARKTQALGRLENKFDALRDRMGDGAGGSAKRQRSEEDKSIAGLKTLGFCTKCAREDVSRKWNTCRDHNPKFAA